MNYIKQLKRLGNAIIDLVFPISCLVCGTENTFLCDSCTAKLPRLEKQRCLVCQVAAPFGKTHPDCVTKNSVDGAVSALFYKDRNVQNIIQTFKYNFVSDLNTPLSALIIEAMEAQGLSDYFQEFIAVPVPLHPRRFNWRGFNQSELLAQSLAEKLNIHLDRQMIARNKYTQPQTRLTQHERRQNIAKAFTLTGNPINKKILLVDDLVTSGSTANEIAKLLKRENAAEIWIISAAHG